MFPLATKRVYDPPSPADGIRILVMRFWPRGVARSAAHQWIRELGTSLALIRKWKQGSLRWTEFRHAYLRELQDPAARQAILEIRKLLLKDPVTLLCSCPDEARCHRSILKQAILQQATSARVPSPKKVPRIPNRDKVRCLGRSHTGCSKTCPGESFAAVINSLLFLHAFDKLGRAQDGRGLEKALVGA